MCAPQRRLCVAVATIVIAACCTPLAMAMTQSTEPAVPPTPPAGIATSKETNKDANKEANSSAARSVAVYVEGVRVDAEVHPSGNAIRYGPIFDALKIRYRFDPAMRTLRVNRPYDNATIELVLPEGLVRANGQVIGRIEGAELEEPQDGWLTPNTISILSGAIPKRDGVDWRFDLDERLRPDTNLELWLNGGRVATTIAPRTSGSVLLIPLRPIGEALGARIVVDGQLVSVTRLQDGIVISWNAQTGLIIANRRPIGVVAPSALTEISSLLLPKDAVAALTGTNIMLAPGSNRIDVNLDDRLAGVTTPSSKVIDRARKTPFELQQTRFQLTSSGFNTLESRGHWGLYNGQFRFEAPADGRFMGGLDPNPQRVANPLRPTWLSLAWQSLEGPSGLFGDAVAARRELDGVNISRLRGVAYQTAAADGQIRVLAGTPFGNTVATAPPTPNQTSSVGYPSFGGSVAGLRWYNNEGSRELGISAKADDSMAGGSQAVLSWNETSRWGNSAKAGQGLGRAWTLYSDLHVGVVNRSDPSIGGGGGRGYLALSGQLPGFWNVGSSVQYNSATFNGDPSTLSNGLYARPVDQASGDISLSGPITRWLSVGARTFARRNGVVEPVQSSSVGGGVNMSAAIAAWNAIVAADYSTVSAKAPVNFLLAATRTSVLPVAVPLEKTDADRLTLTLDKRLSMANFGARYEQTESRGALQQRARALTATLGFNPWTWSGRLGETISLNSGLLSSRSWGTTPFGETRSAGFTWSANMNAQSGSLLGERWRLSANLGVSGTHNSFGNTQFRTTTEDALANLLNGVPNPPVVTTDNRRSSNTGWYFSARSQHVLSRYLTLEWGANKAQGQSAFAYLVLNGLIAGAPPRANLLPRARTGVVQGRVFLDRNGNGLQDRDERGMAGVVVRLGGTPWALRTDSNGNFTINNVPQGPYAVVVDVSSLPLGYRVEVGAAPRISVFDQDITEVSIAVAESGQLRGRLYIDANKNGIADGDEGGAVGRNVQLKDAKAVVVETQTTQFGQFVFDALSLGKYVLIVDGRELVIEISAANRFAVQDVAIQP